MKNIQKFFDTLCVFAGNLLRLNPTSWKVAKEAAEDMRAAMAANLQAAGTDELTPTASPLTYLADSVLNMLALAVVIWIISKIVAGFFALLPYLLGIAFVMWVISTLLPAKGNAVAS